MKRLLLALPLILVASPARAERWVTAASIPYDLDKKPINIVDYQIDVNSIRKDGRSRQREPHGITDMIHTKLLQNAPISA